jgi:hypothetical protein
LSLPVHYLRYYYHFAIAWLRLWERDDGELFYIYSGWNKQLCLIPVRTGERYVISDLDHPYKSDPNPFVAAARGGTRPGPTLHIAVFSGVIECEGVVISVDTSLIE